MKKLSIALTILFILLSGLAGFTTVAPVELTSEEVSYLSKRGPIKLAVDPDWYPYEEIDDEGECSPQECQARYKHHDAGLLSWRPIHRIP